MGLGRSTAGNVKLLLPPRQSRGNSYYGLVQQDAPSEPGPIQKQSGSIE
jgi:hypothetical protein